MPQNKRVYFEGRAIIEEIYRLEQIWVKYDGCIVELFM